MRSLANSPRAPFIEGSEIAVRNRVGRYVQRSARCVDRLPHRKNKSDRFLFHVSAKECSALYVGPFEISQAIESMRVRPDMIIDRAETCNRRHRNAAFDATRLYTMTSVLYRLWDLRLDETALPQRITSHSAKASKKDKRWRSRASD